MSVRAILRGLRYYILVNTNIISSDLQERMTLSVSFGDKTNGNLSVDNNCVNCLPH